MNKTLLFFCFSTAILAFSITVICISPIINNIKIDVNGNEWSFSNWRTLNCKFFADKENSDNVALDDIQKMKKMKNLCNRKKAMHDLEFASLIIDVAVGFICANLSLLHYLNVGKDFEKKTGIIGLISGIIGFIITLVYVSYNGYIFNNDIAYGEVNLSYFSDPTISLFSGGILKLYSNGADYKWDGQKYIHIYENDKDDYSEYIKYKDLGDKQYNYDSKLYKTFHNTPLSGSGTATDPYTCKFRSATDPSFPSSQHQNCEFLYITSPYTSLENKDLHDRWLTSLVLSIIISISNIGLLIFGFLLFKNSGESNEAQPVSIV